MTDDDRQIAARRISGDADPLRVEAEAHRLCGDAFDRVHAVFQTRGEAVLGRQAIADGDDAAAARCGERAADRIMRTQAARQPAAAVKVDQSRQVSG